MRQMTCECGFQIVSATLVELIRHAQIHAKEAHGMELSEEQILAGARELDTPDAVLRDGT